ncbi:unnamed protein product [Porites lobata]|uniref:Endonuclease/exonuclease/phosphatase domain-containing protein n=1 Tax=Porites lobata TaxID=104759 RepID=A0ABN8RD27_9CNID|nr:unnamed protein product [Porites lobata]
MRGFKIAFLNICSLTCHYDELCVFMEDRAIDILDSKVEIFDKFESYLLKLDQVDKESIIMGDTNCNLLLQTFDHKAEHLKFITETYQYIQLIDQPTRITSSTRTLIDHIFTNKPNIVTNHGVLHVGISDHSLIYATHKHNTLKADPKIMESRQFKNFDCSKLASCIPDTASQPEDFLGRTDLNFFTMFEIFNNDCPMYLREQFHRTSEIHDYNLRGSNYDLQLPLPKTNFLKRSFSYRGAMAWNQLSNETREMGDLTSFKLAIS